MNYNEYNDLIKIKNFIWRYQDISFNQMNEANEFVASLTSDRCFALRMKTGRALQMKTMKCSLSLWK